MTSLVPRIRAAVVARPKTAIIAAAAAMTFAAGKLAPHVLPTLTVRVSVAPPIAHEAKWDVARWAP